MASDPLTPDTEAGRILLHEHSSGTPHMAKHILAIEAEAMARRVIGELKTEAKAGAEAELLALRSALVDRTRDLHEWHPRHDKGWWRDCTSQSCTDTRTIAGIVKTEGIPVAAIRYGDRALSGQAVWSKLEATPGFNEGLRQAEADLEAGKGIPFTDEGDAAKADRETPPAVLKHMGRELR